MDRSVPFEAVVGGLAGFALASFGTGLAVALVPELRSGSALLGHPLWWALAAAPVLVGALGWIAGDRGRERERSIRTYQRGVEAEFARLSDQEWVTRAVVTAALDAVLVVDRDGIVTDANPTAARMFGLPLEVLVGRVVSSLLPDRATLVPEAGAAGVETVLVRHTDGSVTRAELRTASLAEPAVTVITLREDPSGAELAAARRAAEQQAERAAHEARVRAQLLLDVDLGLRDHVARALDGIESLRSRGAPVEPLLVSVWSMLTQLERLHDLATWERSGQPQSAVPVSVVDLFDHVSRVLAPLARRHDRAVLVDVDPALGELPTDPALVAAAVRALAREALLRGTGDVVIEVSREPGRDHDWLLVAVALGVALPEAESDALVRALESNPTTLPAGEDAALALGQRVARQLGGRITLRPELRERGTTFGLVLPLGVPGRVRTSKVPLARPNPAP